MSRHMWVMNVYPNEFVEDTQAFAAYVGTVIPDEFEKQAQSGGLHLVPDSITETRRLDGYYAEVPGGIAPRSMDWAPPGQVAENVMIRWEAEAHE